METTGSSTAMSRVTILTEPQQLPETAGGAAINPGTGACSAPGIAVALPRYLRSDSLMCRRRCRPEPEVSRRPGYTGTCLEMSSVLDRVITHGRAIRAVPNDGHVYLLDVDDHAVIAIGSCTAATSRPFGCVIMQPSLHDVGITVGVLGMVATMPDVSRIHQRGAGH